MLRKLKGGETMVENGEECREEENNVGECVVEEEEI